MPDRSAIEGCKEFFGLSDQDEYRITADRGIGYLLCLWDMLGEAFYSQPLAILRQEWWHAYTTQGAHVSPIPEVFFEAISPEGMILDYGCGTAEYLRPWIAAGGHTILVDDSAPVRAYLETKYPQETCTVMPPKAFWDDPQHWQGHIEGIVCTDVLEHVPEPLELQKRLWDILTLGRQMYVGFSTAYPHAGHLLESIEQVDAWREWCWEHALPMRHDNRVWLYKGEI